MKVIILGTAWPYRGGLSAFNERLARQLQDEGHQVEIITFTLQYPALLFPGKTQYSTEPAPEGLTIRRMLNAVNPISWWRTGRYVRDAKPEMVICKFWLPFMAPALGTVLRLSHCRRRISILDNLVPHEHRIGDRVLTRYFVHSIDGMVAMSRSVLADADLFDPEHRKPRTFCPHPLYDHYGAAMPRQEALQQLGLSVEGHYVLFFGFIRDYKGLDLLLDAMADPRIEHAGIRLIVAGEFYGDPKPYMEQIERLGIEERLVLCTSFIADHEVGRYFCAADLVAQPYKSATQSGVTQIAFHFERPMLVTNVGGLPEIVPDGQVGLVVQPEADQIANAVVRFFEEGLAPQLTEGVRQEKKRYAWENMTQTIYNLIPDDHTK